MSNGISINAGFDVGSANPIDARQWLSTEEMKNADVNTMPDPYFAINKEDHFLYIFSKANPTSESTGYFAKYTNDGGMTVWKGSEEERDALPEETKADTSILFYTWDVEDANTNYVVSDKSVTSVYAMTSAEYDEKASDVPESSLVVVTDGQDSTFSRTDAINSINIEYNRSEDTSYYFIRIPKKTNSGLTIKPVVRLTSDDGQVGTSKDDYCSALEYSIKKQSIMTINAGLFKINSDYGPHGRTIVDGEIITDEDAGSAVSSVSEHEVYPLCINADGILSANFARTVSCSDLIAAGVTQAVTGWGTVVLDYEETDSSVFDEIKHSGDYIRQGIGQFQNGDYCVFTTDGLKPGIENEVGMTYAEVAAICKSKGVKFFYSLDGGGSAETCIGNRQINLIYEETRGRIVPTVIEFIVEE